MEFIDAEVPEAPVRPDIRAALYDDELEEEDEMARGLYWHFVLNNYTEEDIFYLSNLPNDPDNNIAYIGFAREVAPSTGTPHLQGHLEMTSRLRWNQLRELVGYRVRLIIRRGSYEENEDYISKEDPDHVRVGKRVSKGKGRRSDLEDLRAVIDSGASLKKISEDFFTEWCRYERGIRSYRLLHTVKNFPPEYATPRWDIALDWSRSQVFCGPAGIGKSEYAKYCLPRALWVNDIDDLLVFDKNEYEGIIFDDMAFTHIPRSAQIYLLDWDNDRALRCRYHNAVIPRHTKKIFVTNKPKEEVFSVPDAAIERRFFWHNLHEINQL